jgi:P-type Cu+ transporter
MVGTGQGARSGILIRNAQALELAEKIRVLAVDKTGTLTLGQPVVTDLLPLGMKPERVLALAAALEQGSEHPLARAILARSKESGITHPALSEFRAFPGSGVEGVVDGQRLRLGSPRWITDLEIPAGPVSSLQNEGKTVVILAGEERVLAILAIADPIRESSREAVGRLVSLGIRVMMLTGDNPQTAAAIARQTGVSDCRAGLSPAEKASVIRDCRLDEGVVAMVGDGINDAPALAAADVSFAMGAGSDAAIEVADITLMRCDMNAVADAILLSRATLRKIRQNLFFAFIYNILGIPLAALGFLNPVIAGAAMALSSVSVVFNALLLKRWKPGA